MCNDIHHFLGEDNTVFIKNVPQVSQSHIGEDMNNLIQKDFFQSLQVGWVEKGGETRKIWGMEL